MRVIDEQELINNKPENFNPNMNDKIESAYNKGWNDCNSEWISLIEEQPTAYPKPTKINNEVVTLSNYATEDLDKVLSMYGDKGYKLVSTLLAPNKFNVEVMYLFFTKEEF